MWGSIRQALPAPAMAPHPPTTTTHLVADVQEVPEALGHHQGAALTLALQQGVGSNLRWGGGGGRPLMGG